MERRNDSFMSLEMSTAPSSSCGPLLETSDIGNPIHSSNDETILPLRVSGSLDGYDWLGWPRHSRASLAVQIIFPVAAFGLVFAASEADNQHRRRWLQWTLSLLAGSLAFCLVIWLRYVPLRTLHTNESYRYRQDSAASIYSRRQVPEGDSAVRLRQGRNEHQQRKHEKRLKLADERFDNYHQRLRLLRQDLSLESEPSSTYGSSDIPAATLAQMEYPSRTASMEMLQQSMQHDQIWLSSGPVQRRTYAHGGLFGAAPMMLGNPQWVGILRRLMPDVYIELSNRIESASPGEMIHWTENNPVVCAYGCAYEMKCYNSIPNIEWDVFLDPALVDSVVSVLNDRMQFLQMTCPELIQMVEARPFAPVNQQRNLSSAARNRLQFFDTQLRHRVKTLVNNLLIAHGNLIQLVLEQTGIASQHNFSSVKRTSRTLGGGMCARQWMAIFAESLRINEQETTHDNRNYENQAGMINDVCFHACISESIDAVKQITKHSMGVVIDLKSRFIPQPVWACVIDCLRESGLRVEAVGSFVATDIRGINRLTSAPVDEFFYFHSAGEVQRACHDGKIQRGDCVFFNAGSLLVNDYWQSGCAASFEIRNNRLCSVFDPQLAKQSYQIQSFATAQQRADDTGLSAAQSPLQSYKLQYGFSIGLYVQEYAIDDAAATLLTDFVNRNPNVFDIGLCWGGVNGVVPRGIQPTRLTCTDGFSNQRYAGAAWDFASCPELLLS